MHWQELRIMFSSTFLRQVKRISKLPYEVMKKPFVRGTLCHTLFKSSSAFSINSSSKELFFSVERAS